ncbi:MAG TPA: YihY/virulence factor BrkB family protein [Terriglobales bacterium]|nr:YihY/virulence factor BrkB family protein [Terriglobales bacterium]
MAANPQPLPDQKGNITSQLHTMPRHNTLGRVILRFFNLLRLAFWRAFQHDAFAIAKASAYSSILTFFPLLLVVGSLLANHRKTASYLREITYALDRILPAGSPTALSYLQGNSPRSVGLLISASLITLWTASGVMISWMEGFRRCYELPKIWGLVKERMVAFSLVLLAGTPLTFATILVASGSRIERNILFHLNHEFGLYVLLMWTAIRWLIATLTSIAVIAVIYHNAVPRTQPWHSVLPGATLATVLWFVSTALFGWYLQNYADYSIIYGSLGAAIALLVWMYLISLVILVGAEFNAMLFPRAFLGKELKAMPAPQAATK